MQQFSKDSRFKLFIVSIFTICVFVSNFASAAVPNQGRPCTDCTTMETSLPTLLGGMLGLRTFLITSALAVVPDADPSTPENNDPREPVLVPEEIKGVGRVDIENNGELLGRGTGYMIDKCLMITNKHVALNEEHPNNRILTFKGGTHLDFISNGTVVESGTYRKGNLASKIGDWSVVKLDMLLGADDKIGYIKPMFLKTSLLGQTQGLAVVGLFQDNMLLIQGHFGCESTGRAMNIDSTGREIDTNTFATYCAALPGTSGGLVTTVDKNDEFRAVGLMNNGSDVFDKGTVKTEPNSFVPFLSDTKIPGAFTQEVYDRLVKQHGCP